MKAYFVIFLVRLSHHRRVRLLLHVMQVEYFVVKFLHCLDILLFLNSFRDHYGLHLGRYHLWGTLVLLTDFLDEQHAVLIYGCREIENIRVVRLLSSLLPVLTVQFFNLLKFQWVEPFIVNIDLNDFPWILRIIVPRKNNGLHGPVNCQPVRSSLSIVRNNFLQLIQKVTSNEIKLINDQLLPYLWR